MKETKKGIKATLRNEIAREYKKNYEARIKHLEEMSKSNYDLYVKERTKRILLEQQVEPLKEKVEQYEDWIERLQDFVNMPEKTRQVEMKTYLDKLKHEKEMEDLFSITDGFFKEYLTFLRG